MQNPILQALLSQSSSSAVNPQIAKLRQMFNAVRAAQNPQAAFAQMMQNDPRMKTVIDAINQNEGDPRKAFYAMAKEKGIDPDEILAMLK